MDKYLNANSVTACGKTHRYLVSVHEEINEPYGEVEGALAQTQLAGHIPAPLHQLPPLGQLRRYLLVRPTRPPLQLLHPEENFCHILTS